MCYVQSISIARHQYCPFTDITRTRELTQSCPSSVDHLPTSHELRQVIDQPTCHLHTTAAAMTTTPAAYKLMKMNPPPNECAAGSRCQGAGKTLGNHYCCRCKKTVHSVFCSKEVVASKFSDLSSTLRLSYKRLESNRVANKQKKAPRQGTLFPFINVRGGSK